MKKSPRFLRIALIWSAFIAVGVGANQLTEEHVYAVEWPAVQLEFEFVSDEVESELACDLFDDCLHLEILNTSQCLSNVSIDLALEDQFGQLIGSEEIIVPSPGFEGGFVIEIGSNRYRGIHTYGVYTVGCSSTLANAFGAA